MKLNRWSALFAGALAVGLAASAYAQYQGPGSKAAKAAAQGPITTVAEVLKRGRDDQRVTLTGNVVKKVGWEKYLFRDASGAIRIEIDGRDHRRGRTGFPAVGRDRCEGDPPVEVSAAAPGQTSNDKRRPEGRRLSGAGQRQAVRRTQPH